MAEKAREVVKKDYSLEKRINNILEIYRKFLLYRKNDG